MTDDSLKIQIDAAESVLVLLPQNPYFDQVAGGLALYLSLRGEKNVTVASPNPMTVEFNRLVGVDKVTTELGSKNLVISLGDFAATNIERVSYDIVGTEFKLTVIPKTGIVPPTKDQVNLSYSGVGTDLVILVGGSNEGHFPVIATKEFSGVKLTHLGVKSLEGGNEKKIMSFAHPSSSVCEVIYELIRDNKWTLDADIATNLIAGIEDSSNGLTSDYVNANTFQALAELMRAGGKRLLKQQPARYPPGAIPGKKVTSGQFSTDSKDGEGVEMEEIKEPPKDWVGPKIYKGTSIS